MSVDGMVWYFNIYIAEYYQKELECRRIMGEDTTNVRVTMSHVYQQMGDNTSAERILEEN